MRSWHLAAVICGFASQLLLLIALGTDYWVDAYGTHGGLWKVCISDYKAGIVCFYSGMDVAAFMNVTRTFMILGMLAGFISCYLLSVLLCRSEIGSFPIVRAATISSYVAGVFALIAMAVFTGKMGSNSLYGWSFGLGWACGPLFLVTGGLAHKLRTTPRAILKNARPRHLEANWTERLFLKGRLIERSKEWI